MHQPTLQELGESVTQNSPHDATHASIRTSTLRASLSLLASDSLTLAAVLAVTILLRSLYASDSLPLEPYAIVLAIIALGNALASSWRGIYPGYGVCAIAEMRTTFYTLTGVFGGVIAISFFTQDALPYGRFILLMGWFLSVPALTISRMIVRQVLSKSEWYGIPVLLIGQHLMSTKIIDTLRNHPRIGLRPLAIIESDEETAEYGYYGDVPVIGGLNHIEPLAKRYGVTHGIVAIPQTQAETTNTILNEHAHHLSHLTFVGEKVHPSVVWISNPNSELLISGEVENRLRQPALLFKKRLFDIAFSIPLIVLSAPLMIAIALGIKFTSRGPAMFSQERVGKKGRVFRVFKFRTMVVNAEEHLLDLLNSDSEKRAEWDRYHKLKDDPRITRIGKWLRKTSLDELPQFFNVLFGDMTLVGARPFVPEEAEAISRKGHNVYLNMHQAMKPGLTGLWQVTVRSDVEFEVRTQIDLYYMRNWSLFLDIYILMRTVGVVMTGRGSY